MTFVERAAGTSERRTRTRRPRRRRDGRLVLGAVVVIAFCVTAVAAPLLARRSPTDIDVQNRLQGPSWEHWLGTDALGRDVWSQVIHGTRVAAEVAIPAVLVAAFVGVLIGMLGAFFGGVVDAVVSLITDVFQTFPAILLALAIISVLGPSLQNVIIVVCIGLTPYYMRVTRAQTLAILSRPFIEAEKTLGISRRRLLAVHVLPNVVPPALTMMAMDLPFAIGAEAGLSFLGLGVQPPTFSWGSVMSNGFQYLSQNPWPVIGATAALVLTTLGFVALSETLRDRLDPRLVSASMDATP